AINFVSVFRWDAEKRRVTAQLSSPFERNPKFNFQLFTDLRSENWNIQTSFQGPTTLLGSLNLRREAIGANFTSFASSRWRWSAGAEISHRDFRSVIPGTALTPILLAKGYQLNKAAQVETSLWRAHIGTRDGRKGRAPLGRNYFLSNWEQDKNLIHKSLLTIKCGPFLDVGKITDDVPGLGSHKWLWDTGTQVKARLFGVQAVLSY